VSATVAEPSDDEDLVATGLQVYKDQYCGICHQLGTAGTRGLFGPAHDGMGTIAQERLRDPGYSGRATTPEGYILESIVQPKAFVVSGYENSNHSMPAYTALSDKEIMALVQMLLAAP
jgi:mono/diheme cytochrome c family protein